MKYSHRKAEIEANRLKNLANPNFEKKQVKYDREKKKREAKRDLRIQAIINGVELDMSYMKSMSNRQKRKEEARIREAKRIREERLAAMGLSARSASRESSPPSSGDEAGDTAGGVKLDGDAQTTEDVQIRSEQQGGELNGSDLQIDERVSSAKKRKSPTNTQQEHEKKGSKKQKKATTGNTEDAKAMTSNGNFGEKSSPGKVAKTPEVPAESSKDKDEVLSTNDTSEDGDEIERANPVIDVSRLDDSDTSTSSDGEDEAFATSDIPQAEQESEGQEVFEGVDAEEDIPLSDLDSLASEDKGDLIPHQRLSINNHAALNKAYKSIALPYTKLHFSDHMSTTTADPVQIADIDDDLNRELVFYKQALDAVNEARPKLKKEGVPFSRPTDYFAEMVKSDEHMGKIKQKLVDEAAGRKAAAEARKQRDLKKFGKQVQIAKQQERAKDKRDTMEKINVLKRKRQNAGLDAADESELFDVALEDAAETNRKDREARKAARPGAGGKPKAKRQKKDEKYGFGGKKRHAKSNDANSTNDMTGFSTKKMKGKKDKKHRPGKSKRAKAAA